MGNFNWHRIKFYWKCSFALFVILAAGAGWQNLATIQEIRQPVFI